MIRVTKPSGTSFNIPDEKLPALCLELAGGGFTEIQTRGAMILQDKLKNGESVFKGGYKIQLFNEVDTSAVSV